MSNLPLRGLASGPVTSPYHTKRTLQNSTMRSRRLGSSVDQISVVTLLLRVKAKRRPDLRVHLHIVGLLVVVGSS